MLITVEGVSGAGKSTLVRALTACLRATGHAVVDLAQLEAITADPAWQLGQLMRTTTAPFAPAEAALLYAARTAGRARLARQQLVACPGSVVVADRFEWSLAVQLRRAGLAEETQSVLRAFVAQDLSPALAILLESDFAQHVRRLRQRQHRPLTEVEFHTQWHTFRQEYDRCPWPRLQIDSTSLSAAEVEAIAVQQIGLLVAGQGGS